MDERGEFFEFVYCLYVGEGGPVLRTLIERLELESSSISFIGDYLYALFSGVLVTKGKDDEPAHCQNQDFSLLIT